MLPAISHWLGFASGIHHSGFSNLGFTYIMDCCVQIAPIILVLQSWHGLRPCHVSRCLMTMSMLKVCCSSTATCSLAHMASKIHFLNFSTSLNQFHLCSVELETQFHPTLSADPRIVVYADGSICIFDGLGALKHQQPALPAGPVLCIASGRLKDTDINNYVYVYIYK